MDPKASPARVVNHFLLWLTLSHCTHTEVLLLVRMPAPKVGNSTTNSTTEERELRALGQLRTTVDG